MTEDCELLGLLGSFHHFRCADDKDKIYAIAGLASDIRVSSSSSKSDKYQMTVISNCSLSTEEVYREIA